MLFFGRILRVFFRIYRRRPNAYCRGRGVQQYRTGAGGAFLLPVYAVLYYNLYSENLYSPWGNTIKEVNGLEFIIGIIAFIVGAAASGFVMFKVGVNYRKQQAESAIGSAEKEAERIIEDAKK